MINACLAIAEVFAMFVDLNYHSQEVVRLTFLHPDDTAFNVYKKK